LPWSLLRPLANRRPSKILHLTAAAIATAVTAIILPACADPLNAEAFGQLALRCGPSVAPSTLAAIARTESGFQPLSINDNTTATSGVPATPAIAIRIASELIEAGHSVDVGIMQINSRNFSPLGLTLQSAFDPCGSIAAAAAILVGDYAGGDTHERQQAALRVAISRYNTGDAQRGFLNGYVHRVELAARRVVPALDVGTAPAAIGSQSSSVPTADPSAPPSWDVWASFDYTAAHNSATEAPAPPIAGSGPAVFADAGKGPTAAVTGSGSVIGR
jgi:type IV secretion system protein VirB1